MPTTGRRNSCPAKVYSSLTGMTAALERMRIEKKEQECLLEKKESDLLVAHRKLESSRKDNKKLRERLKELEIRSTSMCRKMPSPPRTPVAKWLAEVVVAPPVEPVAETVAKPEGELVAVPEKEPEDDPVAESVAEPGDEPGGKLGPATKPVATPRSEPRVERLAEPVTNLVDESFAMPVDTTNATTVSELLDEMSELVAERLANSVVQLETEPVMETVDIPAAEPSTPSLDVLFAELQPTPLKRDRNGYLILKTWDDIVAESKMLHAKRRKIEADHGGTCLLGQVIKRATCILDEVLVEEPFLKDPTAEHAHPMEKGDSTKSFHHQSLTEVDPTSQLFCHAQCPEREVPIPLYGPFCSRHTLRVSKLPGHFCQKCNQIMGERSCWQCLVCARGLHLLCRDY